MGEFLTEKEIERRVEFETRYLPIPEPLSTPDGRFITTYKKKPVRMFVNTWRIYDLLTDEMFKIYTENELIKAAVSTSFECKTDLNTSLWAVVADFYNSYREMNLPILREIDDLARELEELEKDDEKDNDLN
jgi:hypothetical protein